MCCGNNKRTIHHDDINNTNTNNNDGDDNQTRRRRTTTATAPTPVVRNTDNPNTDDERLRLFRLRLRNQYDDHQRCAVFVKLLMHLITKQTRGENNHNNNHNNSNITRNNDTAVVLFQVKRLFIKCAERNKLGDENYTPLIPALSIRLRNIKNIDSYWNLTREYLGYEI